MPSRNIIFVNLVCVKEGIERLNAEYPEVARHKVTADMLQVTSGRLQIA